MQGFVFLSPANRINVRRHEGKTIRVFPGLDFFS
jgi:hypothetical protein